MSEYVLGLGVTLPLKLIEDRDIHNCHKNRGALFTLITLSTYPFINYVG